MSAIPDFVETLYGYRVNKKTGQITTVPNCADSDNAPSIKIATHIHESLGIAPGHPEPSDPGALLEWGIKDWLGDALSFVAPHRSWAVERGAPVTAFYQYVHLARIQELIDADITNTLASEIGSDYVICPDVTVGLSILGEPHLHASISCKWTIRSDRVQNIRHEAIILTRHRRGRTPHFVAVTAEPLPTRIAAIARGTGEVDAVYHLTFDALLEGTAKFGSKEQRQTLDELVSQRRLFPIERLPAVVAE